MKKVTESLVCDYCGAPIVNGSYIESIGYTLIWHKRSEPDTEISSPSSVSAHFCDESCLVEMLKNGGARPKKVSPQKDSSAAVVEGKTVHIHEHLTSKEVLEITGWGAGYLQDLVHRKVLNPIGPSRLFLKSELVKYKANCYTHHSTSIRAAKKRDCFVNAPDSQLLTLKQAAAFLGIKTHSLYSIRRKGKLVTTTQDGKRFFFLGNLRKYQSYVKSVRSELQRKALEFWKARKSSTPEIPPIPPQAIPAA